MPAPTGIRLRESCQACATSKIKCSKDKPQCNRCTEKGTACQYLVTKRTGRKVRRQDSTSGETVPPSSPSTALSSPERELESAAPDLSMLDSHFGALDTAILESDLRDYLALLPTYPPYSSAMQTDTNMLSYMDATTEYNRGSLAAISCAPYQTDLPFQSIRDGSSESSIAAAPASAPDDQLSRELASLQAQAESRQPDSLEMSLRLLGQLSSPEDTSLIASLTATAGRELPACQLPPQFQAVLDENKVVIRTVNDMLQSTDSADGYSLVVICLIISKVLSAYAAAAQALCARGGDRYKQKRLGLSSSSLASTLSTSTASPSQSSSSSSSSSSSLGLSPWTDAAANDPVSSTSSYFKGGDAKDVQQLLDELYQVRSSVDQLGAKMQVCAKRNWMSGSKSPPILHDLTLSAFPFSETILNQLYTELRRHLSTISLELINELKQFWT